MKTNLLKSSLSSFVSCMHTNHTGAAKWIFSSFCFLWNWFLSALRRTLVERRTFNHSGLAGWLAVCFTITERLDFAPLFLSHFEHVSGHPQKFTINTTQLYLLKCKFVRGTEIWIDFFKWLLPLRCSDLDFRSCSGFLFDIEGLDNFL